MLGLNYLNANLPGVSAEMDIPQKYNYWMISPVELQLANNFHKSYDTLKLVK